MGSILFFELAGARALGRPKEMAFFGNTWFWFFFGLVLGKDREVGKRTGVAYRACLVFLLCQPGLLLLLFLAALPPRGGETGVVVVCSSLFHCLSTISVQLAWRTRRIPCSIPAYKNGGAGLAPG